MKIFLTDGPRSGTLARVAEVVIHARGYEMQALGAKTAGLLGVRSASGFSRPKEPLRGGGLEYISAAMLLVAREGDLNASVGMVRDGIEDGAVLADSCINA